MKKFYNFLSFTWLVALAILLSTGGVQAQLAPQYPLTISTGTYSSISATGTSVASGDEVGTNITGLTGFTVNGVSYTNARMCSNGWLALYGTTAPTATTNYTALSTAMTNGAVIFAPFGRDLNTNANSGTAWWQQVGNELVFEWKNFNRYGYTDVLNFQIRLNTSTGDIKFVYGTMTPAAYSTYPQVGWKTNGTVATNWSTDINNVMIDVTGSPNTCNWSNVVTGNLNTSTCYFNSANSGVVPASGLTYSWTKPNGTDPNPVRTFSAVSGITGSAATLTWTAPTGASQYNVQYRAIGSCTWTNFSGNPVSSATATLTGLSPATTYQIRVQSGNSSVNGLWSHIPNQAGTGSGYVAAGTFTTLANACAGTPAPGNTVSSANPVCSGVNFTLSLQNPPTETGITYQWESADDAAFTIGVTNLGTASTQTTSQTTAKYYRCNVTCTNSGLSAYSTALQVTMNSPTYATYNNVSYTESFESWVNGCSTSDRPSAAWENSPNTGNASWRRNDQGLSTGGWSSNSGAYSPVFTDGSYSARFHSYNTSSGTKGSLSLYINMTAATGNTRLSFDHINTDGTDVLKVFLSTDGGVTFTQQGTDIGVSATWTNKTFDFNSTSATTVIKLEATSDYGNTDIGIDKLKLEPAPACLATTATAATNITATTASANWSTATGSWIIEYGPTATFGTPGTGATAGNVNNTVVTASNVSTIGLTGLTASTGYSYVVRQDCSGGGNGYSANSNVITFTTTVACPATTATAASNITTTTASANWSTATGSWIIEYGPTATFGTPGTGATAGNGNNTVVTASNVSTIGLTGLNASTGYSYVVRQDCSGSGNGYSANSNVITFTTACNAVTSFPWAESFDNASLPTCWTQQYVSGTLNWATVTTNGNSTITPHSGARMAEFRNTTTGSATRLVTPLLDLTSLTNPELTFYFANVNWVGDIDELRVYYSTDGGSNWTLIPGQTYTTEHATWQEVKVILPSPNSTYMVAFEGTSNYARGLDLDDVSIDEALSICTGTPVGGTASVTPSSGPSGSNATWAVVGYETGSSGLTYDWQYSTDDGITWTSTGASGDNEIFTMTGPHGTVFQIRYVVGCTPSGMTGYSTVVTFTIDNTNCVPPAPANGCSGDNITSVSLLTLSDPGQTCTPLYEDRSGSQNEKPELAREVPISMSVGVGNGGTEYVGVWIDSDADGLFEAAEYTALGSGNNVTVTGNITIPAGTHAGDVKMRVRTKWGSAFGAGDACAQVGYGSTRDYTVTIMKVNDECAGAISISSDPITDFIDPGTQYMSYTSKSSVVDGSCFTTSPSSKDMWYKITTNGDNGSVLNLTVTPDASMDVALTLFDGTCGTLNAVACSNANSAGVAENMVYTLPLWDGGIEVRANKVYFLRVTDIGGNGTSFTIGNNGSTALPLTLLSFKAQQVKRGEVLLDWRVKDEVNMKQYDVQRSVDGKNFTTIGTVNNLGKEVYTLIDPKPAQGINYYRLSMVESNGLTNYSHIVAININDGKALHASPNPVTGDLTVEVKGEVGKQAVIDIIDYTGNKVRTVSIPAGKVTVDMTSLPTGVYVVQYIDGTTVYTTRVVKM